jgi:hypothetical protein
MELPQTPTKRVFLQGTATTNRTDIQGSKIVINILELQILSMAMDKV